MLRTTPASASSDKPTERGWYTHDRHYEVLEQFVEQLDLRRVTAVCASWGRQLGFRLAVEHPERIERLVVLNTGIYSGRPPGAPWLRFREFVRRTGPDFQPGRLVRITCSTELADEVVAGYDAPFPTPESKTGMLMPELVRTPTSIRPPPRCSRCVRACARGRAARSSCWATGPDLLAARGRALRRADPGAGPAETVEGGGHFLQEDRGEVVGERIARWLSA